MDEACQPLADHLDTTLPRRGADGLAGAPPSRRTGRRPARSHQLLVSSTPSTLAMTAAPAGRSPDRYRPSDMLTGRPGARSWPKYVSHAAGATVVCTPCSSSSSTMPAAYGHSDAVPLVTPTVRSPRPSSRTAASDRAAVS